jgi:peptide/nickel transport system permease protein
MIFTPHVVRVTRAVSLSIVKKDFIEAARARSESTRFMIFEEILPNIWGPIIVEGSLRVTYAILLAGSMSFLGLGTQPPQADWGLMVADGRMYVGEAPWIVISPGMMMCIAVIAFNLFGDGLRDLLDVRMRKLG